MFSKRIIGISIGILLLVAGFAVASGSSEKSSGASASASSAPQKVNLHVFHFKVTWVKPWNQLTDHYSQLNPGVTFNNEIVGGGADWITKLKTEFAANRGPDIFVVDGPALAHTFSNHLTDLSDQPWVKHVLPAAKKPMTFNGKLMGMPIAIEGYGLIYNKEMFKKAGITKLPENLAELTTAVHKLKAAGFTPFASGFGEWWVIGMHFANIPFAYQPNPDQFMQQLAQGKVKLTNNMLFEDWKNLFDLILHNSEPHPLTTNNVVQTQMFIDGKAAMMQQGDWKEPVIYKAKPNFQMGLLPEPLNNDTQAMNKIPVGVPFYFVVNSKSSAAKQAASKKFLNWLVSSKFGQTYITEKFQSIPAFDNIKSNSFGAISQAILKYASEGKTIGWPFTMWPTGTYHEFAGFTQAYAGGQISFNQMLQKMQDAYQRLSNK